MNLMATTLTAAALSFFAQIASAEALTDPDEVLTWTFTEMTCRDYLDSFTGGLGALTRANIAKQIVMAYQKGIADARGTAAASVGVRTGLTCAANPDMLFIDAVSPAG